MKKVLLLIMILAGCVSGAFAQEIYPLLRNAINKRVNEYSYLREMVEQKEKKLSTRKKKGYLLGLKKASDLAASTDFLYDTQNDTILIVLFSSDDLFEFGSIYIRSSKSEKSFVRSGPHEHKIDTREFHEGDKYYLQLLYDGKAREFRKFYIANEEPPLDYAADLAIRIVIRNGKIIEPFDRWCFCAPLFFDKVIY